MSSLRSSQCNPRGLISHAILCDGGACNRRGNQANGTPRTRPSIRVTHIESSSKRTALALGKQFIPLSLDQVNIRLDHRDQGALGPGVEALIISDPDLRCEPKLRFHPVPADMDMDWFPWIALVGIEKELEALMAEDHRHEVDTARARLIVCRLVPNSRATVETEAPASRRATTFCFST